MPQQVTESTTPLAANGVFNGVAQKVPIAEGLTKFRVMAYADQSGTVAVQHSRDGSTGWRTSGTPQAVAASVGMIIEVLCVKGYVRSTYTNGATLQTVFEVDTAFVA